MELQASRFNARTGRDGDPILLLGQDSLIRRGFDGLNCAMALTPTPGPYLLQAMIAACHARAATAAETDWIAMAAYYQALTLAASSPIVEINRAVAVGVAFGPAQGLVDALKDEPRLKGSHLLHCARRTSGKVWTCRGSPHGIPTRRGDDWQCQGAQYIARSRRETRQFALARMSRL
jgi:predicted RNA polymerase sigma factor